MSQPKPTGGRVPDRERQALAEVGRTAVSPRVAVALAIVFLGLIVAVPLTQLVVGPAQGGALAELGAGVAEGWRLRGAEGWLAGNRRVLEAFDTFETRLEDESVLRSRLLPPVQLLLTRIGAGNEQAYIGRGGWLFYRPDVDYVTGPPFDDPAVLERRRRGGEAWDEPPIPDPLPALLELARGLEARGIELLVMPTPVKPSILPGALSWRPGEEPPVDNPGLVRLVDRLGEAGVRVLRVDRWLAALPVEDEAQFLTTDTHWTPRAMEAVAERLARVVSDRIGVAGTAGRAEAVRFERRPVTVDGRGDIEVMLRLPEASGRFPVQRVTTNRVLSPDGRPWSPDAAAEVMLLGDSFTNVFSDASLGWGQGAGLAEHLSYHLARPVDRIARNAGGSNATRRALLDALVANPTRLDGKRVVIYQFAVRELAFGDWPLLPLPTR